MRLIDADKFIEWIAPGHLRNAGEKCFSEADLVGAIAAQPTVYDVDKVVEQLEEIRPMMKTNNFCGRRDEFGECDNQECWECVLDDAIKIVERGGAE